MCGIFGAVGMDIDEGKARACLQAIAHRGPDGSGLWQQGGVTLGHRRLAILDLSERGAQPMSCDNDRYQIVFNGEIYNFLEIREELEKKGYSFMSDTDTEVILAAFMEWKEACQEKFNGMWTFAIWDCREKKLFLSRDRFGVKPLYYLPPSVTGGGFAFASEMKALFPLMKQRRANRKLVMNPKLMTLYESGEECVIEGIRRFPAGHCAFMDEKDMKLQKWWNTLDNLMEVPERYEEQVELFRTLFLDACRLRMRSDVTIGTALSGGLDSSATICAMAHIASGDGEARVNKDWQHAYVASFPGTTQDESAYAEKVTDYLGIRSTFVEIDPLKAIDRLDDYIYMFEDVYLTSPIPMMLLYGALRQDGTIVTIDGHGADELFGGYTFDFIQALWDAGLDKKKMDLITTAYLGSFPKDGSNMSLRGKGAGRVIFDFYRRSLTRKLLHGKEAYCPKAAQQEGYRRLDHLNKILYVSSHETVLPTLLRNYDRYSMANSVEIRMPFMDYRLVCLAFSIGWESKLHGGYSKSIVRDAMAPYMPEEIAYRRTKIGFNTPIVEWMQGPLRQYFMDVVHSRGFMECDLISPERVRRQVEQVITDEHATFAMGEEAFSALYPYLWQRAML